MYWEAVGVLLNWRSDVDEPLDADEALPQLEYVAWAMCDRGVQRLRRDELIELLDGIRREYPNIRPVTQQSSEQFLTTLERRTSLLVEVGQTQHNGREMSVYEFRHLTFQEYLAALALVEGRYPGHDPNSSLADRVRLLAGKVVEGRNTPGEDEYEVTENWREALRLCVSSCNDRDVDETLLAILEPTNRRDDLQSVESQDEASDDARPRAILAALCLADEPNVSTTTAETVLARFAEQVRTSDGESQAGTGLDRAGIEVAASLWASELVKALVREFMSRNPETRGNPGCLAGMVVVAGWERRTGSVPAQPSQDGDATRPGEGWLIEQVQQLGSTDDVEAIAAALAVMEMAYKEQAFIVPSASSRLIIGVTPTILSSKTRLPVQCQSQN